jgi:hypothetical protein
MTSDGRLAIRARALAVALAIAAAPPAAWSQESAGAPDAAGDRRSDAAALDRQKSFVRKQELQSEVKTLEQRWHLADPAARKGPNGARDPSRGAPEAPTVRDSRATFDALLRGRSELDRVKREGQR